MDLEIRHIDRTYLDKYAFEKVIKKYGKIKKDLLIVFDNRLTSFGSHTFSRRKRKHIIRLSPKKHQIKNDKKLSEEAQKHLFIGTILHELRHAQQYESLKSKYFNDEFSSNEDIKESHLSYAYSESETDARVYEDKNVLQAVDYYEEFCEESE